MKGIDWQMLAFVGISMIHDYWVQSHLPRVYYWNYADNKVANSEKQDR